MITLHLAIEEEIKEIQLNSKEDLIKEIVKLKDHSGVWLATENETTDEIIVSQNLDKILVSIYSGYFTIEENIFFLQKYESYEAAYEVALRMREPNNKCYE